MPQTAREKSLTARDWQRAVDSQKACNLLALINTLAEAGPKVWETMATEGSGMREFARHPIIRLYINQMVHLAFDGQLPEWDWESAYQQAQQSAAETVPAEETAGRDKVGSG